MSGQSDWVRNVRLFYGSCLESILISWRADQRAPGVWDDFHVVDGRVVTGQNPASAKSTAEAVVAAFEKL